MRKRFKDLYPPKNTVFKTLLQLLEGPSSWTLFSNLFYNQMLWKGSSSERYKEREEEERWIRMRNHKWQSWTMLFCLYLHRQYLCVCVCVSLLPMLPMSDPPSPPSILFILFLPSNHQQGEEEKVRNGCVCDVLYLFGMAGFIWIQCSFISVPSQSLTYELKKGGEEGEFFVRKSQQLIYILEERYFIFIDDSLDVCVPCVWSCVALILIMKHIE